MKRVLFAIIAFCLSLCNAHAQSAEAEDGHQNRKPEFTVRYSGGFVTEGPAVTAGIKMDDKRTLGIWAGLGDTYLDAEPGSIDAVQTAAYVRRYIHLGERDIVALYCELVAGCEWIYHVNGKYWIYDDPQTGKHFEEEHISASEGDVDLYAGIHAGIRFRIFRNFHLFLGPTLTTNTIGLHLGIGF